MAKTAAERQATYKTKRASIGDERLDILVSAATRQRLVELGQRWNLSQRQALEKAVAKAHHENDPTIGRLEAQIILLNVENGRLGYEQEQLMTEIVALNKRLRGDAEKTNKPKQAVTR